MHVLTWSPNQASGTAGSSSEKKLGSQSSEELPSRTKSQRCLDIVPGIESGRIEFGKKLGSDSSEEVPLTAKSQGCSDIIPGIESGLIEFGKKARE